MTTLYVVHAVYGEYSEAAHGLVKAYRDEAKACKHADDAKEAAEKICDEIRVIRRARHARAYKRRRAAGVVDGIFNELTESQRAEERADDAAYDVDKERLLASNPYDPKMSKESRSNVDYYVSKVDLEET